MKTIIWYQNDLRVDDHRPLEVALTHNEVIEGHYFISEDELKENRFGVIPLGDRRLQFLKESLADLVGSLDVLGIPLYVHVGHPLDILDPTDRLVFQRAIGWNERKRETDVINRWQGEWQSFDGFTLYPRTEIPFKKMPFLFTEFRNAVEHTACPAQIIKRTGSGQSRPFAFPIPIERPIIDARSAFPFQGGEMSGRQRLADYLAGPIRTYKETRNGFGVEDSSKLSAYLANGSLSPRRVLHELVLHEREYGANESTYWLYFELLWREFFQWVALEQGQRSFRRQGIRSRDKAWKVDDEVINRWQQGETGVPFVDAFMHELNATGWMSNRGRQIVASYFAKELGQDWRHGAAYFESTLIDYDVANNYGNWAYQAGVGNDSRDRRFNVSRQQDTYDPSHAFCDTWM